MTKKQDGEGPNIFELRSGLQQARASEGLATDPMWMAIVAPAPAPDATIEISYSLGDGEPVLYVFRPRHFVGPNDAHEPGVGWDTTFRWAQQNEKVRREFERHIIGLLGGQHLKPIVCQHEKGQPFPIVVEGRHSVLACRIANLIRVKHKREFDVVNPSFKRRLYTAAEAAMAAELGNLQYERAHADVVEQRVYNAEVHGWSDAEAAKHYGVAVGTFRRWRTHGGALPERVERNGAKRPGIRQLRSVFEALKRSRAEGSDIAAMVLEVQLTGKLPLDAPHWLRLAYKEVLGET